VAGSKVDEVHLIMCLKLLALIKVLIFWKKKKKKKFK
jgi:hypothetical protein